MTRKRIALSVPPEMDDVLDRISVLTQPKKDQDNFNYWKNLFLCFNRH